MQVACCTIATELLDVDLPRLNTDRRKQLGTQVAGGSGGVSLRGHGERLEVARLVPLVLQLEVGVEGV